MKLQTWLTIGAIVLLSAYIGWTSLKLSRLETAYAKLQTELLDTQNKLKQSEEANKLLAATIQSNDNVYSSVQKSLQSSLLQEQQNRLKDLDNLHSLYESIAQDQGTDTEEETTTSNVASSKVSSSSKTEFTPAPSPFANSPTYVDSKPKAKQAGQTAQSNANNTNSTNSNVSSQDKPATTYQTIVLTEQTNTKVINQLNNSVKEWNSVANSNVSSSSNN